MRLNGIINSKNIFLRISKLMNLRFFNCDNGIFRILLTLVCLICMFDVVPASHYIRACLLKSPSREVATPVRVPARARKDEYSWSQWTAGCIFNLHVDMMHFIEP